MKIKTLNVYYKKHLEKLYLDYQALLFFFSKLMNNLDQNRV